MDEDYVVEQPDENGYVYVDAPEAYYEEYVMDEDESLLQPVMEQQDSEGEYGGMDDPTYSGIVQYKKTGLFPDFISTNDDRNARSHWRLKCLKYTLLHDNLIYINKDSESGGKPRFVIRQGEVLPILKAVHDKIGHLGMKRTQAAVLQSFYWRSVRADVSKYVTNCEFCHKKKLCGKKVSKAPIDVFGPDVLEVGVRTDLGRTAGASRFSISLKGVSDEVVLSSRMMLSSYTFKPRQDQQLQQNKRANPKEHAEIRCHRIPIGHSLDGFHELHGNVGQHGHWIDEEDTCHRKIPKGSRTRRLPENRLNEQVRAAEALNQLSIPSPTKDPSPLAKQSRSGRIISSKQDHETANATPNNSPVRHQYVSIFNGLAARYVAEELLAKRSEADSTKGDAFYEFNIEHWHLPPTFHL